MFENLKNLTALSTLRKFGVIGITAMAVLTLGVAAQASNLVINGDFELTTNGPNFQFDHNTVATGWTSTNNNHNAYNFIFAPGWEEAWM